MKTIFETLKERDFNTFLFINSIQSQFFGANSENEDKIKSLLPEFSEKEKSEMLVAYTKYGINRFKMLHDLFFKEGEIAKLGNQPISMILENKRFGEHFGDNTACLFVLVENYKKYWDKTDGNVLLNAFKHNDAPENLLRIAKGFYKHNPTLLKELEPQLQDMISSYFSSISLFSSLKEEEWTPYKDLHDFLLECNISFTPIVSFSSFLQHSAKQAAFYDFLVDGFYPSEKDKTNILNNIIENIEEGHDDMTKEDAKSYQPYYVSMKILQDFNNFFQASIHSVHSINEVFKFDKEQVNKINNAFKKRFKEDVLIFSKDCETYEKYNLKSVIKFLTKYSHDNKSEMPVVKKLVSEYEKISINVEYGLIKEKQKYKVKTL